MSTSAAATIPRSRTSSDRPTPTTPTSRSTACATIAAGAIARKILGDGVKVRGAVVQLGTQKIDRSKWDWDATGDNPFWCPDRQAAQGWEGYLDDIRKRGSSCGGSLVVWGSRDPAGLA